MGKGGLLVLNVAVHIVNTGCIVKVAYFGCTKDEICKDDNECVTQKTWT